MLEGETMTVKARAMTYGDGPHVPGTWVVERGRAWVAIVHNKADAEKLAAFLNLE